MHRIRIIRYATGHSPRWLYFHLDDTPGTVPTGMFCWLIEGPAGPILVDTGATKEQTTGHFGAKRYQFEDWQDPVGLVAEHVDPKDVAKIIITHTHWDHCSSCLDGYPNADVYLQRRDLDARLHPPHPSFRDLCFTDVIDGLEHRLGKRLHLVDGDVEIADGVRTLFVGGHTLGLQAVIVDTGVGRVAIASDLVPSYDNLNLDRATSLHEDLLQCYRGMDRLRRSAELFLPGHDARQMERHPMGVVG